MCGISGILAFDDAQEAIVGRIAEEALVQRHRGPDHQGSYVKAGIGLAHNRLSILDTSEAAHQPFVDPSGRYVLVYNGELYNFKSLKSELEEKGITFYSNSDTEVLLHLLINEGPGCVRRLQGFFAFAFYDNEAQKLILARDRYGIKPLYFYKDEERFVFGSELKVIQSYLQDKTIDLNALSFFLYLNYFPGEPTIYREVKQLSSGNYMEVDRNGNIAETCYYNRSKKLSDQRSELSYDAAQKQLKTLLEQSVQDRMVSDVPLGSFLSGGIDSSIVAGIASGFDASLNTYSIGFEDHPFLDETEYAESVANHFKTNHTTFQITEEDLLLSAQDFLNHQDQPFADSSAIAVHALSKKASQKVKVVLSGDGADEIFSGYHKHNALYRADQKSLGHGLLQLAYPLLKTLPQSRRSPIGNKIRQAVRFAEGLKLDQRDRYWKWAGIRSDLFHRDLLIQPADASALTDQRDHLLRGLNTGNGFNAYLLADLMVVLSGDMLAKVDRMSMAHGLEVRVPFLDHRLVEFVFSLPSHYKIDHQMKKKILQDAYRSFLPEKLYRRPKKGFEVPIQAWLQGPLRRMMETDLLHRDLIEDQQLFRFDAVGGLMKRLDSSNPGDSAAQIWNLMCFNAWWKNQERNKAGNP